MGRLAELKEMRAARVDFNGKPLPGYARNVAMIDAEISRLEKSGDEKGLHGDA